MMQKIKLLFLNEKGGMDKILVTLFLIIIGVGLTIGTYRFYSSQKNSLQSSGSNNINRVLNEINS